MAAASGSSDAYAPGATDVYLDREISGHIKVRQLVGVGAMGRVYRAFQRGIDRDVAVKILHRELSANQQLVSRFHREAKVASRLQHPNVVTVYLVGQLPDGAMYIVMEYLDGLSLQSALAAGGGAFDLPRVLHIALQLCDAAGEAHAQGIVHRDFKPENVMLVRRGADPDFVKVLDFGIARLNWGEQSMATAAGLIFGTARYISPEGAQGETVGPSGDVYAIATLVYQMLAGRTPFEGEQAVALLVQQIHDPPPHLRSIPRASYVPEPIAEAVMRNLAKDPLAREPDARAFARALVDAAKLAGLSAEELMARPMLSPGRSSPVQLPPMQRTKQLNLAPEEQRALEHMASHLAPPAPAVSSPPLAAPAVSAPPAAYSPGASGQPPAAAPRPSGVEITMDDVEVPPLPLVAPAAPAHRMERTQAVTPLAEAVLPASPGPSARPPQVSLPPVRGSMPSGDEPFEDTLEADSAPVSEDPRIKKRRARSRAIVLFIGCFLVGAGGSAAVAYKMGLVGAPAGQHTLDQQVDLADKAVDDKRWDSPPGDNVRDLTTEGLKRWPNDPRLLAVRAEATDKLVKDALGERYLGHEDKALHLARLAHELDPTDETATKLATDLEAAESTAEAGAEDATDAGAATHKTTAVTHAQPPHATVGLSAAKPRTGQAVDIVVHVAGAGGHAPHAAASGPELAVSGPGVPPGTKVPLVAEGTTVERASLTFLQGGKFELVFTARVDGVAVKSVRTVTVAAPAPLPSTTTTATQESPPVDAGGKWL